jgi:predicted RNA-binding protein with EMAP domain
MGKKETQEANTEELTAHEMKKTSKDLMKFLNSESLSSQEKQQIRFFIKTVANIDRKTVNEKPIEKQILEYFANTPDSLSFTKENRMEANKIE